MNKMTYPKLQRMIDHLRDLDRVSPDRGFNMEYTSLDVIQGGCGTACCIGGHAAFILKDPHMRILVALSKLCDVPTMVAGEICFPIPGDQLNYGDIKIDEAIKVLEHCRDTGEVDWSDVLERQIESGTANFNM